TMVVPSQVISGECPSAPSAPSSPGSPFGPCAALAAPASSIRFSSAAVIGVPPASPFFHLSGSNAISSHLRGRDRLRERCFHPEPPSRGFACDDHVFEGAGDGHVSHALLITARVSRPAHSTGRQYIDTDLVATLSVRVVHLPAITQGKDHLRPEVLQRLKEEVLFIVNLPRLRVIEPVHVHGGFVRLRRRSLKVAFVAQRTVRFSVGSASTQVEPGLTDRAGSILPGIQFRSIG